MRNVKLFLFYIVVTLISIYELMKSYIGKIQKEESKAYKFKRYYFLLSAWIRLNQKNRNLAEWLFQNQYKRVAIYGMGELGQNLYQELSGSEVEVVYTLDAQKDESMKHLGLEEELPEVDAVIVTPICELSSIKKVLKEKVRCPIISLEKVVYGVE